MNNNDSKAVSIKVDKIDGFSISLLGNQAWPPKTIKLTKTYESDIPQSILRSTCSKDEKV